MTENSNKFYVTTPIYYVNDVPHIGHAYTTIAADVIIRHKKLSGYQTFFLTGTDEHGQKVLQAAQKAGISPQRHVDVLHKRFQQLWKRLGVSNDDFIRTTDGRHTSLVKHILQRLYDKGEIYKDTYQGLYCIPCERFWTEKEINNNACPECARKVESITESNYFFRMGDYQKWLLEHLKQNPDFIRPISRMNEVLGFLGKPLGNLCISRPKERLPWGISLPFDENYVTYVWFDALINYISVHGNFEQIERCDFWPADHHIVGKDILTTHSVYWSTMLKAMGLPLPKNIFAHGWWTVNGQKMSKSLRNVVEPNHLIDQFGVDVIRYFLLREVPFGQDGDFSHKALISRVNSDLANNLGNLLNRTVNMIGKYFDGTIPQPGTTTDEDMLLIEKAKEVVLETNVFIGQLAFHKALTKIWELLDGANQYINNTAPWKLTKTIEGKKRLATVLYNAGETLRYITILIFPFMPETSKEIMKQLGIYTSVEEQGLKSLGSWGQTKPGAQIQKGEQLFPRIDEKAAAKIMKSVQLSESPESFDEKDNGLIDIEHFMKLDLRTGTILEAEKIKKSKKLLKLKVDIGSETRQVVAGIASSYEPEQLVGRNIILVANLKSAKLMGIESQGMVLAGNDKDQITLAGFDQKLKNGSKVK